MRFRGSTRPTCGSNAGATPADTAVLVPGGDRPAAHRGNSVDGAALGGETGSRLGLLVLIAPGVLAGSREANDDDSEASPTPPPTRQLTSYHAWSHHRPVSTDQKVQGSNPFGRTSSGAHSSVALSVILTRLGWVIRCPGLSAQEHIDSDQLGRFESSRIVSPRPGLTNAARCSCSPQCRARSQCGSCGNSGHSDSPTAHFRRPVCQAPATGRVSGALQGARQRANAGPAP